MIKIKKFFKIFFRKYSFLKNRYILLINKINKDFLMKNNLILILLYKNTMIHFLKHKYNKFII